MHREIREALAAARAKRPSALKKVGKRTDRIVPLLYAGQRRVTVEIDALEVELDREAVARLTETPFALEKWLDAAVKLRSDSVKRELLGEIGKRLVATGADVTAGLNRMVEKKLDSLWCAELWTALGPSLHLPPNTAGETLDLTKAREVTIAMSWDIWKARRIGPVKVGRSALVVIDEKTYRHTYVRGERKLKHQIKRRGWIDHAVGQHADDRREGSVQRARGAVARGRDRLARATGARARGRAGAGAAPARASDLDGARARG